MTQYLPSRVFWVLCLLAGVAGYAVAGVTGKIAGKVTDYRTREPLPVVNVVVTAQWERGQEARLKTVMGGASDVNGEYFILNVPPGQYTV